ncbi:MAG: DsbE family thiol:disulfide interchange protein [Sutterella sp.]|nr:DsbE family thiol:disulfide interchange protein [Sutterella sp.]
MKAKFLIPFAIFLVLAGFLFKGLYMDPRQLPSVLINKPMPEWSLPTLFDPNKQMSTKDMLGKVWMLNVWSTWCGPCKQEHPYMVGLKRQGLKTPIIGFVYKDQPCAALNMLRQSGNPYDNVVYELKNSVGLDLGVTGVPETFVIDKKGVIRAKVSYPLEATLWKEQIKPLLDKLEAE